jgi:hopanoid biosynthesis associated protein HpnK
VHTRSTITPKFRQAKASAGLKALIINGDDFGLSPEVNAGILRAHRNGVLNSASLMVAGAARREAAAIAHDNPTLDVGLHVVVCRGQSVLASERLGRLVNADCAFSNNPVLTGLRYFFDRRLISALRDECRAQVETHLQLIGYLNHINGHLNFHAHPVLCDILVSLAVEFKVPWLRLVREPLLATLRLSRSSLGRKLIESFIFSLLSVRMRRVMTSHGIRSNDWIFGLHQTGQLSESYLLGLIPQLRPGITELYFHPAADVGGVAPPREAQHEVELLTSTQLKHALSASGVCLTTYARLTASPPASGEYAQE